VSKIVLAERGSSPETPANGNVAVYAKSDGRLYQKNDGGSEVLLLAGNDTVLIGSGTTFPGSPSTGDMFYRTDARAMCYYDGTRWVGDVFVLPMSNWAAFSRDVTSTTTVFSASMPDFGVFFEKLALAFNCGSVDASNYWTITFFLHNGTSQISLCSYTINSGSGWARTTLTSFSPNPAPSSSIYILVQAAMTGSPGNLDVMSTLFVRRVFT
jgi:hypothetical protein